jgi:serine protease Do
MGKVIKVAPNTLQSDCVLMGGDSGGPLFNLQGELIGIHSQIWENRDQNVHVSLAPFLRSWDALKNSEVVRVWQRGAGGWLGVATRENNDGSIEVDEVAQNSPAQRAGLRSGDKLVSIDRNPLKSAEEFSNVVKTRAAGDSVVLVVRNKAGDRIVTVKLTQQPAG